MGRKHLLPFVVGLLLAAGVRPAGALETDQYYTWGRPLTDSTDVLNLKVNLEIDELLRRINRRSAGGGSSCRKVTQRIASHFKQFIFHDIELWTIHTSQIARIPATPDEELRYRKEFLYRNTSLLELASWVPPSPTIQLAGVRIGTDKLAHFFSEGALYHRFYRSARKDGLTEEAAERRMIDRGLLFERTVLGLASSGVLSLSDLEANYQGMRFFRGLCHGDPPTLERTAEGWRMRRAFDFRDYVTPEWDESYQTSIYTKRRWRKVRPVLTGYCPALGLPEVEAQRRAYSSRDRLTPTESRIRERIAAGKLPDPRQFSIEHNCPER